MQWTLTGSRVAGNLEITYLPQNGATQLTSETDSFTGVLASGNVTLTIDQSILGASNLSGTFDGSVLTLSIPSSDGTLQQVTLKPASLSD